MATAEQIFEEPEVNENREENPKRERLIAIVSGGQSKEYLGKEFSIDKIGGMTNAEIDKLYIRYEARLGSLITKNLGNTLIQLYSTAVSKYFSIDDQSSLTTDLQRDPFLGHALNSFTCNLYHKFGMFLAPFTTAATTIKHCQLNNNNKNGRSESSGTTSEPTASDRPAGTACEGGEKSNKRSDES